MVELILGIVLEGLKFLNTEQQNSIKNKIIQLKADYAEELGKSFNDIDDARIYSLEFELRDILQLYYSAIQGQSAPIKS